MLQDVFQHSSPVQMLHVSLVPDHGRGIQGIQELFVLIKARSSRGIGSHVASSVLDGGKVLDILDTLFKVGYSVDEDRHLGIERDLPVDVGLSVHEGAVRVLQSSTWLPGGFSLNSKSLGLSFGEILLLLTVVQVELHLTNDAVLSLTVRGAVDEQSPIQLGLPVSWVKGTTPSVMAMDRIDQVLNRQVSISNDILLAVLVETDLDAE